MVDINQKIIPPKKRTIKYLYIKIFIPVVFSIIIFLISSVLYAFFFPNHIYFIKNQSELSKMHVELLEEKLKRIDSINAKINSIDNDYLKNDSINHEKYIELRTLLINERDSLWNVK